MSNMKMRKLPEFKNEQEEREYWTTHDSADHVDWSGAQFVTFPNLRASTVSISLRLPEGLLGVIRNEANRRDVPYQSLMKIWLAEKADEAKRNSPKRARTSVRVK